MEFDNENKIESENEDDQISVVEVGKTRNRGNRHAKGPREDLKDFDGRDRGRVDPNLGNIKM